MSNFFLRLREIVWPSVLAVVFSIASIAFAIFVPLALPLSLSLGLASISMALLAQRA
jgi:hypothetical protein